MKSGLDAMHLFLLDDLSRALKRDNCVCYLMQIYSLPAIFCLRFVSASENFEPLYSRQLGRDMRVGFKAYIIRFEP
jgi:hypothetical protein